MTDTSFSIHELFMYLPFLANTFSSAIQLIMKSAGKILCMSDTFTFLSLPVGSETSNCLVPLSLSILKFGTYLASHFDLLSKFLIITRSLILNLGTSSCLSCFFLECASLVLRAASMYV